MDNKGNGAIGAAIGILLLIIGFVVGLVTAITFINNAVKSDIAGAMSIYAIGGVIAIVFMVAGGVLLLSGSRGGSR